ncbi:MAG: glycoside hydrolase family 127 protein [Phycisphaerae bacterium]|nr:glycoside hydrolase family 127 protein [Phycisphaerae bacterium]
MRNRIYESAVVICLVLLSLAAVSKASLQAVVGKDVYQAAEPGQVIMKGYLGERMRVNREGRLKKHITEKQLLAGFRKRPGSHPWIGEHVGKWLHAATLAWENKQDDEVLRQKIKRVAQGLMASQMKDGYLGTYLKADRWSSRDENRKACWDVWVHKYCLIGLLSYYQMTGDQEALDASRRIGDLLIDTFDDDKLDILKAGTHAGMAATSVLEPMSLLYELTGERKYEEFAEYVIRRADAGPKILTNMEKTHTVQSVGNKKAYEMMSNYVGLVEFWRAGGYKRGLEAAKLAWESIESENVFITGAPDAHEHFSEPHTLTPSGACTETCVQVTWIQMTWQLLRATGDPRYAAMLHHHIYNHMPAAQHPDGINWCYMTTMEGKKAYGPAMHCCGSSGPRAIALIPTIAYMTAKDKLAVNLYENSQFKGEFGGVDVTVRQQTDYPWDGRISIEVETAKPVSFDLQLLVPQFVQSGQIRVAGSKRKIPLEAGKYATIHRNWSGKTEVAIQFDMPMAVHEWKGRYALSRGPIILALEKVETEGVSTREVVPDASYLKQQGRILAFEAGRRHPIHVKGRKISTAGGASSDVSLLYRPYCEAGTSGESVCIWLPTPPATGGKK